MFHIVEVRICNNLAAQMAEMRMWFDQRGFHPRQFRYFFDLSDTIVHIDFEDASEAHAFVKAFGARIIPGKKSSDNSSRQEHTGPNARAAATF